MSRPATCSDPKVLERFVLGMLPDAEVEPMAQHVQDCPACVATLHGFKAEDTLSESMRLPARAVDQSQAQFVARLSEKMSQLSAATSQPAQVAQQPQDASASVTMALDEDARRRFKAAWRAGKPAPIEDFLPADGVPHYLSTLEELVHIELEFQWNAWSARGREGRTVPPNVENYLARFPRLDQPDVVQRLVEQEFRVRRRHGDDATVEEYKARFPALELATLDQGPDVRTFLAPAQQPGEIGRLGGYRILKILGTGGMGIVYQAEDPHLQRLVALKVMKPELASRPDARQRFVREARAVAAFNHDHILSIFQVGEDRGVPYLAMPLLEGETLDDRLKRQGRLPVEEALRIGREIALGLAAAHARGLIHRDIKPANIWLETNDERGMMDDERKKVAPGSSFVIHHSSFRRVKIMDFGLARAVESDARLTQTGVIVGSPAYMAPEQARGETVDGRADLFSLGCLLYRACTGRLPFQAKDAMSTLLAVAMDAPLAPSQVQADLPAELSELIVKLLAKSPAGRPASAGEVADALLAMSPSPAVRQQGEEGKSAARAVSGRRRRLLAAALVGLAVLGATLFFAPTVLRFATNQGELVVEIDDPEVEVAVKHNDLVIRPRSKEREFVIKAGKGVLEVYRPGDKEALTMEEFELARGGKMIVTVRLGELAKAKITPMIPDLEKPFVLLRDGGGRDPFATLDGALRALGEGKNVLEIHGNGPFFVPAAAVKDKSLVVRAAPGYRPQIHAAVKNQSFLQLQGTRFAVDGCDFRLADPARESLFAGTGPAWEFNNCRFLVGPKYDLFGLLAYQGPRLKFTNCLVSYPSDWSGGSWLRTGPGKMDLEISNCLLLVGGRSILPAVPECDWKVTLHNNTIIHSGALLPNLDMAANAKLDVHATGNIFQLNIGPSNVSATPFAFSWKDKIRWEGTHNLYAGPKHGLALWHDKEGKKLTYGLAGWEEIWGKKETGSAEARQFYPAWRELYYAASPQALVAAAQSLVRTQAAPRGGQQLGPNWDVVGPGEAYLRALAAAGKPVPAAKLRPKPVDGSPVVVLRDGKVVRDFVHLREAVAFAQSGDVVELRTDGPITGEDLTQEKGPRQITIRAAPGYIPVIRGYWPFANLTLSVEGLHFQGGGLTHGFNKNVRLTRVANCTFSCPPDAGEGAPIGPPDGNVPTPADGPLEIVNCVMPGRIALRVEPGSRIVIRNSLVGYFLLEGEAGKSLVDIDRSVLWQPPSFYVPHAQFAHLRAKEMDKAPEFAVRASLVDNATRLIENGNALKTWKWIGERNVYRLSEQAWCNHTPDGSPPPTSLSRWQSLWNSDADSIRLDPHAYDPLQWKLLPGTPGSKQGLGGKDMGADVRSIGTMVSRDTK